MATVLPFVALYNVATGQYVLSRTGTTEIINFDIVHVMDDVGTLMIEVPFADEYGLAQAMIDASGGQTGIGQVTPCILQLSLDGYAAIANVDNPLPFINWDSSKWLERPARSITASMPTFIEEGPNTFAGYAVAGVDRVTFILVSLDDVFNALPNTVNVYPPINTFGKPTSDIGLILPGKTLPYVKGIYQTSPGRPDWAGKDLLKFVPILDNTAILSDGTSVAKLPITFDLWGDYILKATQTIVNRLAGLYFAYDANTNGIYPGSRGHFVADPSDAALNITRDMPPGVNLNRADRVGQDRGIAIGHVGDKDYPHLTFIQGTGLFSNAVDETINAVISDGFIIDPVAQDQYAQAEFTGGSTDLGLPQQANITGMFMYNPNGIVSTDSTVGDKGSIRDLFGFTEEQKKPGNSVEPFYLLDKKSWAWDNSVPVICMGSGSGNIGGVFYSVDDGQFHRISQQMSVNYMVYEHSNNTIYIANDFGIYYRNLTDHPLGSEIPIVNQQDLFQSDPNNAGLAVNDGLFTKLGSLTRKVIKVMTSIDLDGTLRVFALVNGNGPGGDGLFTWPQFADDSNVDVGHGSDPDIDLAGVDGWSRFIAVDGIQDFTVYQGINMVYFIDPRTNVNNQGAFVSWIKGYNPAGGATQPGMTYGRFHDFGRAELLSFCHDGYSPNIFLTTQGGSLYLYRIQAGTQTVTNANADKTMQDVDGLPVQVNRIIHYGSMRHPVIQVNDYKVALLACTDHGLFFSPNVNGGQWQQCNGQSGLNSVSLTWAAGGWGNIVVDRKIYRMITTDGKDFYQTNNGAMWWTVLTQGNLTLAPFWYGLYRRTINNSPQNAFDGTDTSPIAYPTNAVTCLACSGDSGINFNPGDLIQIAQGDSYDLPGSWQWARRLDEHNDWTYRLINTGSNAPFFGTMFGSVSELQANLAVPSVTASEQLAQVTFRWLSEAAQLFVTIQVESQFTSTEAALRSLRPTQVVWLNYVGNITRMVQGSHELIPIGMAYVEYVNTPFFVLKHEMKYNGANGVFTVTQLATSLQTKTQSPDDLAADMQYALKNIKKFGL